MNSELIANSMDLLIYGLGVVFVFLTVLVFATQMMSRLITRFFPEPIPTSSVPEDSIDASVDPLTLKIIQTAIDLHRHRSR